EGGVPAAALDAHVVTQPEDGLGEGVIDRAEGRLGALVLAVDVLLDAGPYPPRGPRGGVGDGPLAVLRDAVLGPQPAAHRILVERVDPRGIDQGEPFFERAPGTFGQRPDHRAHHVVGRLSHPRSLASHGCPGPGCPGAPWTGVPSRVSGSVTKVILHPRAGIRPGLRPAGQHGPARSRGVPHPSLARAPGRYRSRARLT